MSLLCRGRALTPLQSSNAKAKRRTCAQPTRVTAAVRRVERTRLSRGGIKKAVFRHRRVHQRPKCSLRSIFIDPSPLLPPENAHAVHRAVALAPLPLARPRSALPPRRNCGVQCWRQRRYCTRCVDALHDRTTRNAGTILHGLARQTTRLSRRRVGSRERPAWQRMTAAGEKRTVVAIVNHHSRRPLLRGTRRARRFQDRGGRWKATTGTALARGPYRQHHTTKVPFIQRSHHRRHCRLGRNRLWRLHLLLP